MRFSVLINDNQKGAMLESCEHLGLIVFFEPCKKESHCYASIMTDDPIDLFFLGASCALSMFGHECQ